MIKFIRTNLDEMLIITSFLSMRNGSAMTETDEAVLAAFQRYSAETSDLTGVQSYLDGLSDDQIAGVVSSVKGILHEMEFVKFENSDGDPVTAAMFQDTSHKGYDVVMSDSSTGETWEVQLKATGNQEYVQDWLDKHPDGEILLSEEIAGEMGLQSSGIANEELTVRVEEFVDNLVSRGAGSSLWDLFPTMCLLSVSFVLVELYRRYQSGEISGDKFRSMAARATGIKAGKLAILTGIMCIPVVNVAVGAALVAKILYSLTSSARLPPFIKSPKELSNSDYMRPTGELRAG